MSEDPSDGSTKPTIKPAQRRSTEYFSNLQPSIEGSPFTPVETAAANPKSNDPHSPSPYPFVSDNLFEIRESLKHSRPPSVQRPLASLPPKSVLPEIAKEIVENPPTPVAIQIVKRPNPVLDHAAFNAALVYPPPSSVVAGPEKSGSIRFLPVLIGVLAALAAAGLYWSTL